MPRLPLAAVACLSLYAASLPATGRCADAWQLAVDERGVRVHTRAGAGGNLPEFRGLITVDASVWQVLAILDDLDRTCEWTKRCVANRELKRAGFKARWFYHRTAAPWPFADRDAVMRGDVTGMDTGIDIRLHFRKDADSLLPPVDGVVRMPVMQGHYRVERLTASKSRVTMQIRAHPGGWIPNWAARWVSKRIPVDTLVGLRKQLVRTRGQYDKFLTRWDPAHGKPSPGAAAP